jgi:hypothetical protein
MRFHAASGLAVAGAIVVALTATACSNGSTSVTSTPTATTTPTTPATTAAPTASASATSTSTGSSSGAVGQITANWVAFFNPATPNSQRVALLQNGSTFSSAISSFSSNPLAAGISAKVVAVTLTSATQATVKYDIDGPGGTTLLANQTGTAVLEGGSWKVGDTSFCALLRLAGGTIPSACNA